VSLKPLTIMGSSSTREAGSMTTAIWLAPSLERRAEQ